MDSAQSSRPRHNTVKVSSVSLKFEDALTEQRYQRSHLLTQRELWLRALLVSSLFQCLFHCSDLLEFGSELAGRLHVVVPARLALAAINLVTFLLVQLDLLEVTQRSMAVVSLVYGIPTVLLFAAQRAVLRQWDALFLVYGLCWFVVPKLTPLQFLPAAMGSAAVGLTYFSVAALRRPAGATGVMELSLAALYTVPAVCLFLYVSYSTEKASRERFVLRSVLSLEHRHHVSLAVVRPQSPEGGNGGGSRGGARVLAAGGRGRGRALLGLVPWAALALGRHMYAWLDMDMESWVRVLFADKLAAHIAFTHFVGIGLFLMILTRKVRFLFAVPAVGAAMLSVAAQAPLSPHVLQWSLTGVGHGMLALTTVFALGALGWIAAAWRELLGFVRRFVFLHPREAEESMREFPVLRRMMIAIPESVSSKAAAAAPASAQMYSGRNGRPALPWQNQDSSAGSGSNGGSSGANGPASSSAAVLAALPPLALRDGDCGICGFCGGAAASFVVPVCRRWGLWALWRQELDAALDRARAQRAPGGEEAALAAAKAAISAPCTSFADLVETRGELERQLVEAAADAAALRRRLEQVEVAAAAGARRAAAAERHWWERLERAERDGNARLEEAMSQLNVEAQARAAAEKAAARLQRECCEAGRAIDRATTAAAAAEAGERQAMDELAALRDEVAAAAAAAAAKPPLAGGPTAIDRGGARQGQLQQQEQQQHHAHAAKAVAEQPASGHRYAAALKGASGAGGGRCWLDADSSAGGGGVAADAAGVAVQNADSVAASADSSGGAGGSGGSGSDRDSSAESVALGWELDTAHFAHRRLPYTRALELDSIAESVSKQSR